MKSFLPVILFIFLGLSCVDQMQQTSETLDGKVDQYTIRIAIGSCNKVDEVNVFWDDISEQNPEAFVWSGDIVYADSDDITVIESEYNKQKEITDYARLSEQTQIFGIWDDHDYGKNDGGQEFEIKAESQQALLDFLDVSKEDQRRTQEGVYASHVLENDYGTVELLMLDTRYFRSSLTFDTENGRRYKPNRDTTTTLLGDTQWQWLENKIENSQSNFLVIVSSIQILSNQHQFEKWENLPHERERMITLISRFSEKNIFVVSGDRHISEFSIMSIGDSRQLIDFTSSGLTHSYSSFSGEPNPFRVKEVVSDPSYGIVDFNLKDNKVHAYMMGDKKQIQQKLEVNY
tara:strand:+ start:7771 stop:8808 length:1038 start_codon:yes stop_codon:yes gene_type:complete